MEGCAPLLWPASTGSAVCIPGQQLTAVWAESYGCALLASASVLDLCLHPGPDLAGPEQQLSSERVRQRQAEGVQAAQTAT